MDIKVWKTLKVIVFGIANWMKDLWKHGPVQLLLSFLAGTVVFFLTTHFLFRMQTAETGCKSILTLGDSMNAGGKGFITGVLFLLATACISWHVVEWIKRFSGPKDPNAPDKIPFNWRGTASAFLDVMTGFLKMCFIMAIVIGVVVGLFVLGGYIAGHLAMWMYC